jgi:hypothetical protein
MERLTSSNASASCSTELNQHPNLRPDGSANFENSAATATALVLRVGLVLSAWCSVFEVSTAGEDKGDTVLIGGLDHFIVAH